MKTTFAAAALAAVSGAAAYTNGTAAPVYVTEVVTAFTTYCPAPTTLVHNQKTYTVTEATTLTISDCPCTITKPVVSAPIVTSSAPYPVVNGTTPVTTKVAVGTGSSAAGSGSATKSAPATYTGAAGALSVPAGLAAIMGFAAYAL